MDDLIDSAWLAEEALLSPAVRKDARRLAELLAPEFTEIGQSGRRWSRSETITGLVAEIETVTEVSLTEREALLIGRQIVLLSYRLQFGARVSRRSSVWRRDETLVCLFHQGTPVPL
jgi:hypothetical protein